MSPNPVQSPEELAHWTHAISIFRRTLERDWDHQADAVLTTSIFLCLLPLLDKPAPVDGNRRRDQPEAQILWLRTDTDRSCSVTCASICACIKQRVASPLP